MTTIIIIVLYIIGAVLSFGRVVGSSYGIEEYYIEYLPCSFKSPFFPFSVFVTSVSWIGFLAGIIIYWAESEKYFFKWSFKPLIEKWKKQ